MVIEPEYENPMMDVKIHSKGTDPKDLLTNDTVVYKVGKEGPVGKN